MQREGRVLRAIPAALCVLWCAVLAVVLGIMVIGQQWFGQYYQNRSLLSNAVLWPIALAAMAGLMLWRAHAADGPLAAPQERRRLWRKRALFVALLAVQLVIVRCAWYKMGWDIANVYTMAEQLARGVPLDDPSYFRLCPNNAPLTVLQALPMWVAVKLGLAEPFVVIVYLDAVLLNLTAYTAVSCVERMTHSRFARRFALWVSVGWIALSPFVLYPYTDTYAILFPVLALYVYLRCPRPLLKWFGVSALCFVGASIKATVLILLVALLLLGVCRFLARRDFGAQALKRAALVGLIIVLGAVPGRAWQNASTAYLAGSATPEEQLSETHYLMLGMNGDTYGGHSPDDVTFTTSFATLAEKKQQNLRMAWERFVGKGFVGNVRFFAIKAFKAYNDGSFAANSSFLDMEVPKRTDALSTAVRSVYYQRGAYNQVYHTVAQTLWLMLLMLCAFAAARCRKRPEVAALCLTLLGLTAYLLLFEVWPRYLFLYAPFYAVLAAMAFDEPLFRRRKQDL